MTTAAIHPTLADALWHDRRHPRRRSHEMFRAVVLAVAGSALLTLSAKVQIPFYPVPLTMQTLVLLTLAMAYGWRLGAATALLYLAEGAVGLPVFAGTPAKGVGVAYMLGPTGGYLIGFVAAAAAAGALAERGWDRRPTTAFAAMLAGNVIIYIPGLLWLGALVGWDKPILAWGLYPFVVGDLAKILLAMVALPAAWRLIKRGQEKC